MPVKSHHTKERRGTSQSSHRGAGFHEGVDKSHDSVGASKVTARREGVRVKVVIGEPVFMRVQRVWISKSHVSPRRERMGSK